MAAPGARAASLCCAARLSSPQDAAPRGVVCCGMPGGRRREPPCSDLTSLVRGLRGRSRRVRRRATLALERRPEANGFSGGSFDKAKHGQEVPQALITDKDHFWSIPDFPNATDDVSESAHDVTENVADESTVTEFTAEQLAQEPEPNGVLAEVSNGADSDGSTSAAASSSEERAAGGLKGRPSGSGLRRSPTSGGVQSATSAHGLPDPAVAVRNLVAQSRTGQLCTIMSRMHHRRSGYPFGCTVDFATDLHGHPIFSLSALAIHTRNLLADPRCTLVVQIPGWSGLADARVTLFGEVYPLAPEYQEWAKNLYRAKHPQEASEQWGNSHFFRMEHICDVYFVGGFGTVSWIDPKEYASVMPDKIASENSERTLEVLNARFAERLRDTLSDMVSSGDPPVESVAFIAVDGKGLDLRVQQGGITNVRRLSFNSAGPIETTADAEDALENLLVSSGSESTLTSLL